MRSWACVDSSQVPDGRTLGHNRSPVVLTCACSVQGYRRIINSKGEAPSPGLLSQQSEGLSNLQPTFRLVGPPLRGACLSTGSYMVQSSRQLGDDTEREIAT